VEHLHPTAASLAVFDEVPIRHLIRPCRFAFRDASKERFEAGPHLPKLTKGQRIDAPDLFEPPLPLPLTHGHAKGVAVQLRCLLHHQVGDAQLLLGDTGGGEAGATHPTTVISARAVHANALELVVGFIELEVRHKPLLLVDRVSAQHTAPIYLPLTQSASEHSMHLHLHSKARSHGTASNGMLDRAMARAQRTIHSRTSHRHPIPIHHPPHCLFCSWRFAIAVF
jgi:hypothetical protein